MERRAQYIRVIDVDLRTSRPYSLTLDMECRLSSVDTSVGGVEQELEGAKTLLEEFRPLNFQRARSARMRIVAVPLRRLAPVRPIITLCQNCFVQLIDSDMCH